MGAERLGLSPANAPENPLATSWPGSTQASNTDGTGTCAVHPH
jgi:hypothetical protein